MNDNEECKLERSRLLGFILLLVYFYKNMYYFASAMTGFKLTFESIRMHRHWPKQKKCSIITSVLCSMIFAAISVVFFFRRMKSERNFFSGILSTESRDCSWKYFLFVFICMLLTEIHSVFRIIFVRIVSSVCFLCLFTLGTHIKIYVLEK